VAGLAYVASSPAPEEAAEAVLIVRWPAEERGGGMLAIDGNEKTLSSGGDLVFTCAPGAHKIAFSRPGYQPFVKTLEMKAGSRYVVQPAWGESDPRKR
jgi:hypothetical protein